MKYVDEYRNPKQAKKIIKQIESLCCQIKLDRPIQVMEVCGGHTHAIFRYGIKQLLPDNLEFVHGPGCPVCVLPRSVVDKCIELAGNKNVIFTTFGDAKRVRGSKLSLLEAKAQGLDVRMIYSPLDALQIATSNPQKKIVFFGLGFETTMPATALSVLQAKKLGLNNFFLFCNHITIIPTLQAVLAVPEVKIDGFIGPGHVSAVIGSKPYQFIADKYRKPLVIAGFEPLDILQALWMVLNQLNNQQAKIENQYSRVVCENGQAQALAAMQQVFEVREYSEWRGLGVIEQSGVQITQQYQAFDAEHEFKLTDNTVNDPKLCQCGEVLTGMLKPWQCRVFGTECTPENPLGALMVSSEGACSAHYSFNSDIENTSTS